MGLSTSKDCNRLFNRVSNSDVFPSDLKLNTRFPVLLDGKLTYIDTAALPSSCQSKDAKDKVNALLRVYDDLMDELATCAREGFDSSLHKKKPWSAVARAKKAAEKAAAASVANADANADPDPDIAPDVAPTAEVGKLHRLLLLFLRAIRFASTVVVVAALLFALPIAGRDADLHWLRRPEISAPREFLVIWPPREEEVL